MDAPSHGHIYEGDAQRPGLHSGAGEDEHHEKTTSVLKKVKDKAKKIKDTISQKTHGHREEPRHDEEEDEEEGEEGGYDEHDEKERDPDVHGAPMYESEAARDFVSSHEGDPAKERFNIGGAGGRWEEDPGAPKTGTGEPAPGCYQTGVADISSLGGPEPGVIRSMEAMSISDRPAEEEGKKEGALLMESHDQFSPPSDVHGTTEGIQTVCEGADPERRETEQQQAHVERSYKEKLSSATAAIADKATLAKEAAVGSAEYGKKIAEAVYEKVAGAGSAVASTVSQQQEKKGQQAGASGVESGAGLGKARMVSMKEYLAEKLSPGEEDRALCEVISEVIHKREEEERGIREEEDQEKEVSGEKKAGRGVVAKIKGAVSSLLGGSRHAPPPTMATGEATDSSGVGQEGGRGPQASSN